MYRKLIRGLVEWKENREKKPLLVGGERQVGKSWLVRKFADEYYENQIHLNEAQMDHLETLLKQGLHINFGELLETVTGIRVIQEDTLVILDDLHQYREIVRLFGTLQNVELDYDVIGAGGFSEEQKDALRDCVKYVELRTMDFEEFLYACGESRLAEVLRSKDPDMVGIFEQKYMELLKYYYFVGGMPAAVRMFCETRDIREVRYVHQELLNQCPKQSFLYTVGTWDNGLMGAVLGLQAAPFLQPYMLPQYQYENV